MSAGTEWRAVEKQLHNLDIDAAGALGQQERQRLFLEVRGELAAEQGFKTLLESAPDVSAGTSWPLAKRQVRTFPCIRIFSSNTCHPGAKVICQTLVDLPKASAAALAGPWPGARSDFVCVSGSLSEHVLSGHGRRVPPQTARAQAPGISLTSLYAFDFTACDCVAQLLRSSACGLMQIWSDPRFDAVPEPKRKELFQEYRAVLGEVDAYNATSAAKQAVQERAAAAAQKVGDPLSGTQGLPGRLD